MKLMSRRSRTCHQAVFLRVASWREDADCNLTITIKICWPMLMRTWMKPLPRENLWLSKCIRRVGTPKVKPINSVWLEEALSIIRLQSQLKTGCKRHKWCTGSHQGSRWVTRSRWPKGEAKRAEIITINRSSPPLRTIHMIEMIKQVPKTSPMTSRIFSIN